MIQALPFDRRLFLCLIFNRYCIGWFFVELMESKPASELQLAYCTCSVKYLVLLNRADFLKQIETKKPTIFTMQLSPLP
jgi:hypothetical protein